MKKFFKKRKDINLGNVLSTLLWSTIVLLLAVALSPKEELSFVYLWICSLAIFATPLITLLYIGNFWSKIGGIRQTTVSVCFGISCCLSVMPHWYNFWASQVLFLACSLAACHFIILITRKVRNDYEKTEQSNATA